MSIINCIADIISASGSIFETNQEIVIRKILQAEKAFFLDTCFVSKSLHLNAAHVFGAFRRISGGKEKQEVVFVVSELVLYELKDSADNVLQAKNREFLEKMSAEGFSLLVLKEETVCSHISPFMKYSKKQWNEIFIRLIHDNIATLGFSQIVRTDKRMPYFGFSEVGFPVPGDADFINDIIVYLKNMKKNKDSLAEELIGISLLFLSELTHGSMRNEYIFCTDDFGALARMNKVIQTSYPTVQNRFKAINMFTLVQYMMKEKIMTSKKEAVDSLKKIMGGNVKLLVENALPFCPKEETLTIDEAVDRIFNDEQIVLLGRKE